MKTLLLALLAFAGAVCNTPALADTTTLPDPSVSVTPNYANTTTIVSVSGVTYRGASAFYYVSECAKPDSVRYHCNILQEDNVVLVAPDGSTVTVSLTIQSASTLITSGHNYWRHTDTVLAGSLTI